MKIPFLFKTMIWIEPMYQGLMAPYMEWAVGFDWRFWLWYQVYGKVQYEGWHNAVRIGPLHIYWWS
jgi:hypothetical protein